MNDFLILLALILFVALVSLKREWGIYLIVLLLPTYQIRFQLGFMPLTFLECMILLLAGTEFFFLAKNKKITPTLKQIFGTNFLRSALIFLFFAAAAISVFMGPDVQKSAGIFKAYFFEAILFYFLVILIIDNEEKLNRLWQVLAIFVTYISIFGIYQFLTLANLPVSWWAVNVAPRRITSLLNHPNALALLLGPVLAMLFLKPQKNKLVWLALGLGFLAIYLSFSRASWLALIITLSMAALFTEHKKKILSFAFLVALLIFLLPFSRTKIIDLAKGEDLAQENRLVLWSAATDIIKKSPIFGVGLTGFREAYKDYPLGPDRVIQNYPHNFFLNFWLETGFLGFVAMIGLLIIFYKKIHSLLHSEWRGVALACGAGMAVIILHGLVDVPYFKNDLSVLFWLIYALPNLLFLKKAAVPR